MGLRNGTSFEGQEEGEREGNCEEFGRTLIEDERVMAEVGVVFVVDSIAIPCYHSVDLEEFGFLLNSEGEHIPLGPFASKGEGYYPCKDDGSCIDS